MVQRADHRERRKVDALRAKARLAGGLEQPVDHLAAGRNQHDAGARALGGLDDPERVVLEDGLVELHGNVLLRLEADRGGDLLGGLQRRQVDGPHHDAVVGDADAHALAELVLGEHVAQDRRKRLDVDDLAIANDAGRQRGRGGALDGHLARAAFDGGDVAGLDVESDESL